MSDTSMRGRSRYDAVVVGARCAGAATAMLLARSGLKVLAIDRSPRGSDTLSTHALMRGGVVLLERWGVLPALEAAGTPAVRTTSFHYADDTIAIPIKPKGGLKGLYAPRRTVLDERLVEAALEAGAEVVHQVGARELLRDGDGRVRGIVVEDRSGRAESIEAGMVIGADGVRSKVARMVGARAYRTGRHASGTVYGYCEGLETDGYEWYYRPGVSVGVIPTNDGLTCVFASAPAERFHDEIRFDIPTGYRRILREAAPELAEAVAGARLVGKLRGFPGVPGFLRDSHGPGWALVGDAGYFKDPITAHGITDALIGAELLARAVVRGTEQALADYQATRDDLATGLFEVTDEIASYAWTLEEVQRMHVALSEEMKREVRALATLDPPQRSVA